MRLLVRMQELGSDTKPHLLTVIILINSDWYAALLRLFEEKGEKQMTNPWKEIPLSDYERHMQLDTVYQLQTMNQAMKKQLDAYPVSSAIIVGLAGGNGLEYVDRAKYRRIYGVDINRSYLQEAEKRYADLGGCLQCLCLDLAADAGRLPRAQLLIANLLIEYVGYGVFQETVKAVAPEYVSCMIQINGDEEWVSESPYIHVFDRLDEVHHQLSEKGLSKAMQDVGYVSIYAEEYPLPNKKKLLRLDYVGKGQRKDEDDAPAGSCQQ